MSDDRRPRFVVLGASNVARGFASLVARVRGSESGPVEILAAHGRGRSYGVDSRFLWGRELGSIQTCGLWPALCSRTVATNALVCDIGNDLAYGARPEVIASWVERALDRLAESRARIVVVGLPLATMERLGPVRFAIARTLIFPGRKLELAPLLDAARVLEDRLAASARARDVAFVKPDASWFGVDPIHYRSHALGAAWSAYLAPLGFQSGPRASGIGERVRFLRRAPESWRLFGREQRRAQPCMCFDDGTTISEF